MAIIVFALLFGAACYYGTKLSDKLIQKTYERSYDYKGREVVNNNSIESKIKRKLGDEG